MSSYLRSFLARSLILTLCLSIAVPAGITPRTVHASTDRKPFAELYADYYASQISKQTISRVDTQEFIAAVLENPPTIEELREFARANLPASTWASLDPEFERLAQGTLSVAEFQEILARVQRMNAASGLTWECGSLGMIFFAIPFLALVGIIGGVIDLVSYGTNRAKKIEKRVKEETEYAENAIAAREKEVNDAINNVTTYEEAIKRYNASKKTDAYGDVTYDELYNEIANIYKYVKNPVDQADQLAALKNNYQAQLSNQRTGLSSIRPAIEKEFRNGVPIGWLKIGGGAVATVLTLTCGL